MRLENDFPRVRNRIRREGYVTWAAHRELLVSFAGMMAARSPMFRTQAEARVRASLQCAYDRSILAKNYAITLMRAEIATRRQAWQGWDWALGYTTDPSGPLITSDQTVGMWGNRRDQTDAFADGDFWVWCPLSWDMCLIGSSKPLGERRTTELDPQHLAEIRRLTREQAGRFVVSPVRLKELESA